MKPLGRVVWITGASSGIGAALARQVALSAGSEMTRREDVDSSTDVPSPTLVILTARRADVLHDLATECTTREVTVEVLPCDLCDPMARDAALAQLAVRQIVPDLIILNAGVSQRGDVVAVPWEVEREVMELNHIAAVHLTKGVLPGMIAAGGGHICAVSSVAGVIPVPLRSGYNASKAALIAFFETLAMETRGMGVNVSIVVPGFVRTEISRNARTADGGAWGVMDSNQERGISPELAAQHILAGIRNRRRWIYTGLDPRLRVMLALRRWAPRFLAYLLTRVKVT